MLCWQQHDKQSLKALIPRRDELVLTLAYLPPVQIHHHFGYLEIRQLFFSSDIFHLIPVYLVPVLGFFSTVVCHVEVQLEVKQIAWYRYCRYAYTY